MQPYFITEIEIWAYLFPMFLHRIYKFSENNYKAVLYGNNF